MGIVVFLFQVQGSDVCFDFFAIVLLPCIQAQSKYRRYSQYLHHPLKLFLATASGSAGRNQNNVAPIGSLVEWNKKYKSTFAPMVPVSVAHAIDTRVSQLWGY